MPELPEVHTTVKGLEQKVLGLSISDVWTDYFSKHYYGKDQIKDPGFFKKFKKEIRDQKIISVSRRAKNVLIHLENNKTILIHMKMTGHLLYGKYSKDKGYKKRDWQKEVWTPTEEGVLKDPFNRFIHLVFTLSNKRHLVLSDVRKFAKVTLIETNNLEESKDLKNIGPEPNTKGFTFKIFKKQISKRPGRPIKQVLMDSEIIAGIGNIYSDEILFESCVHPKSVVKSIPLPALKRIFKSIKPILKKGINLKGDSTSDYRNIDGKKGDFQNRHKVYRKTGEKCPKRGCKGKIEKTKVASRSAHFCPTHQKKYV